MSCGLPQPQALTDSSGGPMTSPCASQNRRCHTQGSLTPKGLWQIQRIQVGGGTTFAGNPVSWFNQNQILTAHYQAKTVAGRPGDTPSACPRSSMHWMDRGGNRYMQERKQWKDAWLPGEASQGGCQLVFHKATRQWPAVSLCRAWMQVGGQRQEHGGRGLSRLLGLGGKRQRVGSGQT